jgi:hypothetical protein
MEEDDDQRTKKRKDPFETRGGQGGWRVFVCTPAKCRGEGGRGRLFFLECNDVRRAQHGGGGETPTRARSRQLGVKWGSMKRAGRSPVYCVEGGGSVHYKLTRTPLRAGGLFYDDDGR